MREVAGFMTTDGTFYDKAEDARLHEAVQTIKGLCESHKPKPIAPEKYLQLLNIWSKEIREFIDANDQTKEVRKDNKDTSATDRDQADDTDGDALDAAVVQQSVSGSEHVPSMGSGTPLESVQPSRKVNGSRSRRNDA